MFKPTFIQSILKNPPTPLMPPIPEINEDAVQDAQLAKQTQDVQKNVRDKTPRIG